MYNMLFGRNPNADFILATIGLTKDQVGRFRDVWVEKDRITIHTRLGGGNRECYCDDEEIKKDGHHCMQVDIQYLQKHPGYISDVDCEGDSTYANFYFAIPEKYKNVLVVNDRTPNWNAKIEELKTMPIEELKAKYPEMVRIVETITEEVKTNGSK